MSIEKELCTGCNACHSICPVSAISMEVNEEGFLYPRIDSKKCINCKMCEKVCPVEKKYETDLKKIYAACSKQKDILKNSSSGGIFYELSKIILLKHGYVCGAAFDDNNQVHHIIIDDINKINLLMRSKYVQSRIDDCFIRIKDLLNNGETVLFVGTGCQVNGLHSYLQKKYNNLLTVDIICHGAPSPKIWDYYLNDCNKKIGSSIKINNINFRDKKNGWKEYGLSFNTSNNIKIFENHNSNLYFKLFLKDLCLRESCYKCNANGENRLSDMTLGDFWGCKKFDLKINNENKGLSLIICHSDKGLDILKELSIEIEEVENTVLNYNPSYYYSAKKPKKRDFYMETVNENNFSALSNDVTKDSLYRRLLNRMIIIIKSIIH